MDGADRVKPRPGMNKQDVCEWRATPPGDGMFATGKTVGGVEGFNPPTGGRKRRHGWRRQG
jgi:hypothetical protein